MQSCQRYVDAGVRDSLSLSVTACHTCETTSLAVACRYALATPDNRVSSDRELTAKRTALSNAARKTSRNTRQADVVHAVIRSYRAHLRRARQLSAARTLVPGPCRSRRAVKAFAHT